MSLWILYIFSLYWALRTELLLENQVYSYYHTLIHLTRIFGDCHFVPDNILGGRYATGNKIQEKHP